MKRCNRCGEEKPESGFYTNGKKGHLRPECKACNRSARKQWQRENPQVAREYKLRTKYGLSEVEFQDILDRQGGTCALCERTTADSTGRPLHVDHSHETGWVRGALCSDHNTGIGKLGDTSNSVLRAVQYLVEAEERYAAECLLAD